MVNKSKDYLWNSFGVLLQNAISPVLLIFVTRINGLEDSGLFSFAFSISIVFWAIGLWGGRTYQVSDTQHEFESRAYIMARFILSVIMFGGVVTFCALSGYSLEKMGIIVALTVMKMFESIADSMYGVMQLKERLYLSGVSLTIKAVSGLAVFVAIDLMTGSIFWASFGLMGVNALVLALFDVTVTNRLDKLKIKLHEIAYLFKQATSILVRCWPIFAVTFMAMFSLNIPRYFVDKYHEAEIGYFGILAMPVTLVLLVMGFILQPQITHLSKLLSNKQYIPFKKAIWIVCVLTCAAGAGLMIITALIGRQTLELVFGISFAGYDIILLLIVLGAVFNATIAIFINVFIILRRFKAQFYILLLTNVLLTVASYWTIRHYGLNSAIILYALINAIQSALFIWTYKKYLRDLING